MLHDNNRGSQLLRDNPGDTSIAQICVVVLSRTFAGSHKDDGRPWTLPEFLAPVEEF
jgi:hypothetical protein